MLATIFLWFAPMSCFVIFALAIITSLMWQIFARIDKKGSIDSYTQAASACCFAVAIFFCFFIVFLPYSNSGFNDIRKLQVVLIIGSLLSSSLLFRHYTVTIDHITFCIFVWLSSLFLLSTSNLITMFFTLELINMLVIYSFFFNSTGTRVTAPTSSLKISSSCIYQFILNFFSSIILFGAINVYIAYCGTASISNVSLWQTSSGVSPAISLILITFLLKFGSGPWIFYKINIYRNMNFVTALMYTIVYLVLVFTFFLNLIFLHNLSVEVSGRFLMGLIAGLSTISFATLAFQSSNFFVFLSFSSLINLTILILQVVSIL